MELIIYPRLHPKSQRLFVRTLTGYGKKYEYQPRSDLVRRLSEELLLPREEILEQAERERRYLIGES